MTEIKHDQLQYSPFLLLPREIRDRIYDDVLNEMFRRPESPIEENDDRIEEDQGWGSNFFEHTLPTISCLGLLGCSRQVADELREAISRINIGTETGIQYQLDLMIWDASMQPTWLSLPAPRHFLKSVRVDFRIFRHGEFEWTGNRPILGQYLLQMLRRFLDNGPHFIKENPTNEVRRAPRDLCLESLTINFVRMEHVIPSMRSEDDDNNTKPQLIPRGSGDTLDLVIDEVSDTHPTTVCKDQAALWALKNFLEKIAGSGLLFGRFRFVKLCYGGKIKEWIIEDKGNLETTLAQWKPYGWGSILQSTQELIDHGTLDYDPIHDCVPRSPEMILKYPPLDQEVDQEVMGINFYDSIGAY